MRAPGCTGEYRSGRPSGSAGTLHGGAIGCRPPWGNIKGTFDRTARRAVLIDSEVRGRITRMAGRRTARHKGIHEVGIIGTGEIKAPIADLRGRRRGREVIIPRTQA